MGAYAQHGVRGVGVSPGSLPACMIEAGVSPQEDMLLLSLCQAVRTHALNAITVRPPPHSINPPPTASFVLLRGLVVTHQGAQAAAPWIDAALAPLPGMPAVCARALGGVCLSTSPGARSGMPPPPHGLRTQNRPVLRAHLWGIRVSLCQCLERSRIERRPTCPPETVVLAMPSCRPIGYSHRPLVYSHHSRVRSTGTPQLYRHPPNPQAHAVPSMVSALASPGLATAVFISSGIRTNKSTHKFGFVL